MAALVRKQSLASLIYVSPIGLIYIAHARPWQRPRADNPGVCDECACKAHGIQVRDLPRDDGLHAAGQQLEGGGLLLQATGVQQLQQAAALRFCQSGRSGRAERAGLGRPSKEPRLGSRCEGSLSKEVW